MKRGDGVPARPALPGDHPVLEFLNTRLMVEGRLEDQLRTDADVVGMLKVLGWARLYRSAEGEGALLAAAKGLREELRDLVERRKAGEPLDLAWLNGFLREGSSHLEVRPGGRGLLTAVRVWTCGTPQQALAPLAEAAADLLSGGDFKLIRRCEGETCVLWFYDRTRSHKRRWCSMASCGNRHKVTAFRRRQGEGAAGVGHRGLS